MPPTWMKYGITQGFGAKDEPLDSGYAGQAHFNKGLDLGTPLGTLIDAAVGGTVESVGDAKDGWGISVKVRDADGNLHNYGHLSAVNVRKGQQVAAGTFLGKSGNTGKSTGPHLSYDVSDKSGQFIDPSAFVGGEPGGGDAGPAQNGGLSADELAKLGLGGGGAPDPYGPQWDDAKRVDALGQAGYRHRSGRGKDAKWVAPDGTEVTEASALAVVTKPKPVDTSGSLAEVLSALLRRTVASGSADLAEINKLAAAAVNARDSELKQLRLDDGTVITQAMLNAADPVTRQQYQQEIDSRAAKHENDAIDILNKYALTEYATGRAANNDANTDLNNSYKNEIDGVRQKLDLDQITIDQASKEVSRILQGMGESRARAELETSTALKAAPFATKDGKTSFSGDDLGASVTGLARIGGVQNPETTPLISFPGTQRIDVSGMLKAGDMALGIAGQALPAIPKVTTTAADLPTPPTLTAGPAVPQLTMPVRPPQIAMPTRSGAQNE